MKVSFRENEKIQTSVSLTQEEMKAHKAKKHPVFKSFITMALLLAIAVGATKLYRKNIIYTHGIVSAAEIEVKAIDFDKIQSILVEKGDIVQKGDVLFTQYSSNGKQKINKLKNKVIAKENEFHRLLEAKDDAPSIINNDNLSNELEILTLKQRGSTIERKRDISIASGKIKRLNVLLKSKAKRHADILKLFNLDAATRQQVEAAATNLQIIKDEHKLAVELHRQLIKTNNLAKQEAFEQQIKAQNANEAKIQAIITKEQETQDAQDGLFAEIERLRSELADLKIKYKPSDYLAPFDAIITNIYGNDQTTLAVNEPILNMASINNLWVDVYVEADKAKLMTKDKNILIYPEGSSNEPIKGKSESVGKIQISLPLALRDKFSNVSSAVYFHVKTEDNDELIYGNLVKVVVN